MLYIIRIQHNRKIEEILFDHENETSKLSLVDITDLFKGRMKYQKFYRRGEHLISCYHNMMNIVFSLLVLTGGILLYKQKAIGVYAIWLSIYLYLFTDLVLTFSLLYFKMNREHNFEFKRTKRSMQFQFVFMLLAILGHLTFLIYFFGI